MKKTQIKIGPTDDKTQGSENKQKTGLIMT